MAEKENPPVVVDGPVRNTRGAQVILTGDAVVAARGGFGDSIEDNTVVRKALEADGSVADGMLSVDGKTETGKPAADVVVTEEGKPGGAEPAEPGTTRVEVKEPAPPPDATTTAEPPKPVPRATAKKG